MLTICSLAVASTFAASQPQRHDGFFLSLAMGIGFQSIDFALGSYDDETSYQSTVATNIDFKIGFSLNDNLALHLTLAGNTITSDITTVDDLGDDDEFSGYNFRRRSIPRMR